MADDREEGTTGLVAPGPLRSPLTRRTLLGGAAVVIGGAALAACTTGGNASDQGATAAGTTSLLKKIQDRGQLNVTASTAFFRAQLLFPKATVTPLAQDEALLSVATGKADACLVEDYLAKPFVAQHSNVILMNNGAGVATEFGCWGVLAGDYLWWRWLDNWISYNIDNAQLPGMYTNTFGLNWVHPS